MGKLVGFLVAMVVAGALVYAYVSQNASGPQAGSAGAAQLEQYRGKVVLLDFWATWCGPCKQAMPGVQRLHEKFAGRPVAIVGANCWENGDPAAYMAQNGYTYELMTNADELAKSFGVTGIPTFVVLDPDGELVHKSVGYSPSHEQEIAKIIEAQLAEHNL